ncbi:MAG TPA: Fe-S cluster assembly protein SufD [Woeseiaceae bacterium]|nr:Fe-S cluster assembly protein SufD [Woeseiaceae bacterium]
MNSQISIQELTRALHRLPGTEQTTERRRALQLFADHGFPGQREEDWKYTDLSSIAKISRTWLSADAEPDGPDLARIHAAMASIDAAWIVFANGSLLRDLSPGLSEPGVSASDAVELDVVAVPNRRDDPLSALNRALSRDGLRLQIKGDNAAARPIGILTLDAAQTAVSSSQVRVDIELAPGSAARFVELHLSTGEHEHYSNCVVNLVANPASSCDYVRIQQRDINHSQTARLNLRLQQDSHVRHAAFDLGGKLTRNDLQVDLVGQGASCVLDGLYFGVPGRHIDNHIRVDHCVGPSTSMQDYRGILTGKCRGVWNGKAVVHKGADGTDATQSNHNLLLSEHAEINAKPELEIYAEDVKCAHGTTVGQLDEQAIYYLRTRGIDESAARRILTGAFAAIIVEKSPIPELLGILNEKVVAELQKIAPGVVS